MWGYHWALPPKVWRLHGCPRTHYQTNSYILCEKYVLVEKNKIRFHGQSPSDSRPSELRVCSSSAVLGSSFLFSRGGKSAGTRLTIYTTTLRVRLTDRSPQHKTKIPRAYTLGSTQVEITSSSIQMRIQLVNTN